MDRRMILYRGSLKSCNYQCSYCPFSKGHMSRKELERDKGQWEDFIRRLWGSGEVSGIRALMVVPYGEALIHPWYWNGLAGISALPWMEAVGAQTNLSFPVRESLDGFVGAGGRMEKLRLWATFHPEMTTVREFAEKCRQLKGEGAALSAGAVGVPGNLPLLRQLRMELPPDIYLWVNRMDGLRRSYTQEEKEEILSIDPYFYRELIPVASDVSRCRGRLFVEGNGGMRICNISPLLKERGEMPVCGRKRCSCYLAYGGREEYWNRMLFGPYPLFRIPRHPKAVFLDVEGTLLPGTDAANGTADGKVREIPERAVADLEALFREGTYLFFATTLPMEEAVKRCRKVRHLFRGGIFAGGAHLVLEEGGRRQEWFHYLEEGLVEALHGMEKEWGFRLLVRQKDGRSYKATLLRPRRRPWAMAEAQRIVKALPDGLSDRVRYVIEGNCLQLLAAGADKAGGVRWLCEKLHIPLSEAFAAGDSEEDEGMMRLCGG